MRVSPAVSIHQPTFYNACFIHGMIMFGKDELTPYDKNKIKEVVKKEPINKIAKLIQNRHESDVWCRALIDEFLLYRDDRDISALINSSEVRQTLLQKGLLGPCLLTTNTNSSPQLIEKQWLALKILFPTPESFDPFKTHVDILLALLFFVANKEPPTIETLLLKLQINHRLVVYQAPYGYRIGDQWLIKSSYDKHYDYSTLNYLISEGCDVFAYDPEKYNESSLTCINSPDILIALLNSVQGKHLPLACINTFGDTIMHHVLASKQLHVPELLGHKLMRPYLNSPNRKGLPPLFSLRKTEYTEQTMKILIANGLNLLVPDMPVGAWCRSERDIGFLHDFVVTTSADKANNASLYTFFAKNQSYERRLLMQEIRTQTASMGITQRK